MKTQDEQHLDILSILHYVYGGLMAFGGFIPLIYVAMGFFILSVSSMPGSGRGRGSPPPPEVGYFMIVVGLVAAVLLWVMAVLIAMSGRFISARKKRMFCLIIAGIECVNMPLGTILGVFTIIILCKETVTPLFEGRRPPVTGQYAELESFPSAADDERVMEPRQYPQ